MIVKALVALKGRKMALEVVRKGKNVECTDECRCGTRNNPCKNRVSFSLCVDNVGEKSLV